MSKYTISFSGKYEITSCGLVGNSITEAKDDWNDTISGIKADELKMEVTDVLADDDPCMNDWNNEDDDDDTEYDDIIVSFNAVISISAESIFEAKTFWKKIVWAFKNINIISIKVDGSDKNIMDEWDNAITKYDVIEFLDACTAYFDDMKNSDVLMDDRYTQEDYIKFWNIAYCITSNKNTTNVLVNALNQR